MAEAQEPLEVARVWTIRGRGDHHVPELDGPYLDHNVCVELVELSEAPVSGPECICKRRSEIDVDAPGPAPLQLF